jgi:hypothetical protein
MSAPSQRSAQALRAGEQARAFEGRVARRRGTSARSKVTGSSDGGALVDAAPLRAAVPPAAGGRRGTRARLITPTRARSG